MTADKNDISAEDKKSAEEVFDFIAALTESSGIPAIDGIGLSSIQTGKQMFRGRFYAHKKEESGPGMLWSVFNESPQKFSIINSLPADTVYASGCFFLPKIFWQWLNDAAVQSKSQKIQSGLEAVKKSFENKGLAWDAFLESFDGEINFMLIADRSKKNSVPLGPKTVEMEKVDFAIVCIVKDDAVFNALKKALNYVPTPTNKDTMRINIPMPQLKPLPWLKPVIVQQDNRLFIASNIETVERLQKPSAVLKDTEEFKALAVNIPVKGNSYEFLSSRLVKTIVAVLKQTGDSKSQLELLESVEKNFAFGFYGVSQVTETGFISTFNVTVDPAAVLAAKTVLIPAAFNIGMMLPMAGNVLEQRRRDDCADRLKELGFALKMHAMNNKDRFPENSGPKMIDELLQKGFIKDRARFCCPSGKPYAYIAGYMETSDKNIPLLFDFPGNHSGNFVNVLFLDGRVQGIEVRLNSCSDLINFLHQQFNYSPELYKQLLEKAVQLDKTK
jgi:prepilin-type processing-associated H-X9-DG protein